MSNCFLLISHHRSGSNFLCNLLCANKNIVCLNEPLSMHTSFFKENDLIEWNKDEYNDKFLHRSLKKDTELIDYLKELRLYLTGHSNEGRVVGFKETLLFEKLSWVKEFIPELKIIYLVRDPRAVVNSVMRNDMYKIWNYDITVNRYLKTQNKPNTKEPIEMAVWSWKIRNNLFNKYKDLFEYKIIRLEDIVNSPVEYSASIMDFLNVELSKEQEEFLSKVYVDNKKGKEFSVFTTKDRILYDWKAQVSDEIERYIREVLHDEMAEYGYL